MGSTPRVVVLDDDPTGTQTIANLPVVLQPDPPTLAEVTDQTSGPFWVLTNTRALREPDAVSLLRRVSEDVRSACGEDVRLVLRGDSTLRGHILAEIDALSSDDAVALFVPAFVEQGRTTLDGVHTILVDGVRVPVAQTEYARDAVFGYHSSHLVDWVHEHDPARPAVSVPLATIRAGFEGLSALLQDAPPRTVVAPDVQTVDDLELIATAWTAAIDAGRDVVLRCGSSLASVVTHSQPRQVDIPEARGPVLVVCASHTSGATAQLNALLSSRRVASLEIDVAGLLEPGGSGSGLVGSLSAELEALLASDPAVLLSTPRSVPEGAATIVAGAAVMDAIVRIVAAVRGRVGAVVTKGGITSARVARDGLDGRVATALGQVLPGVPVWQVHRGDSSTLTQVVVPGNIGEPSTLATVVAGLVGEPA
jgi:uncharacterized protein YgbK (DUF1537 family)